MVTDYTGAVAGSYLSLPFGDGFSPSGDDESLNNFALLWHDFASATDHAQFRQYSEAQGRWMTPDPYDGSYDFSNPQSFNRYSYVLNNPLSFVDPQGLFTLPPQDGGGGDCWWCWDWGGLGGTGGPIVPPSGGNGGSGGAPSKPKSPARQMCEKNAQQKYNNAKSSIPASTVRGALYGGAVAVGGQLVAGCAVGTGAGTILGGLGTAFLGGEGAFAGAPVGCITGAVSAVLDGLPQTVAFGLVTGGVTYVAENYIATNEFNQDMQACSQIP